MAFNIILQHNNSELNRINKNLSTILELSGTLREDCSITDPIILVSANLSDLCNCNYLTIEQFKRSYFVNDITSVSSELVRITCHVDVISSFAVELLTNRGIVQRAEGRGEFNLYLNDGSLKAYQDPYILTSRFPNGFDGRAFILAVAGG